MRSWIRCVSFTLLAAVLVLSCWPVNHVAAQGLPMLPGMGLFDFGSVRVTPSIQIGYGNIGLNFNLPAVVPRIFPNQGTLDLVLKDTNVWIGCVAVTADFPSGLSFALKGQANAKKDMTVFTPTELQFGGALEVWWTGEQLEWWTLEGSVAYRMRQNCSLLVGLRREHLSVGITNPRDSSGNPLNLFFFFSDPFGTETEILTQTSDLTSKLWIPYLGMRVESRNYRASFLWSPFAIADVRIPAPLNIGQFFTSVFGPPFTGADFEGFDVRYKVLKPSTFLEANFEYDLSVSSTFAVRLWGSASWIGLRGQGSFDIRLLEVAVADGIPFESSGDAVSDSNTAIFGRRIVAGGLSVEVPF